MKIKLIILTISILFSATLSGQSPWTQGKNKAFVQAGFSGIFYDKVRTDAKDVTLNTNISDVTAQLYSEFGLTTDLDISIVLPYKTIKSKLKDGTSTTALSGFGNVSVGLKYKFFDKQWKISSGLYFSSQANTKNELLGLRTGFGASTFMPYLSAGTSKNNWYYFANVGYGLMTNNYTDFVKMGGEVGYKFAKNTHIIFNLDYKKALKTEDFFDSAENEIYQTTTLYTDKQEFGGIGLKLNHEFVADKFGINLGAIGAFYLNNLPAAPSINTGIYYKL